MKSLALLIVFASCTPELGLPAPWTPAAEISGDMAVEIGTAPVPAAAPMEPSGTLRVVSFNVERGEDVDGLAAAFTEHPDLSKAGLLLLQEEESHPSEGSSRASRLAAALGMNFAYLPARMKGDASHGLAILSAYPIVDLEEMALPDAPLNVARARRIAVSATIVVDGKRLQVINVHLDTVLNVTDRILQLHPVVIGAPEAVLMAGDFNTNDWIWAGSSVPILPANQLADTRQAPIIDDYMRGVGFATPCSNVGPTERMSGFAFRLDAFFPRGLTTGSCHVAHDVELSDHWPLWIDLTL